MPVTTRPALASFGRAPGTAVRVFTIASIVSVSIFTATTAEGIYIIYSTLRVGPKILRAACAAAAAAAAGTTGTDI